MILISDVIRAKRDGNELSPAEIAAFIDGYTSGAVPDYQASALLMAIVWRGMSDAELGAWTEAMLRSGEVIDLSDVPGYKVDKHSTGGVGDKVSLPLAPLAAEAGLRVPMISGRGLGHTGGTLDKLEAIPGFRTDLSVARFRELVDRLNVGLIGQTAEIAPADKKLYALRDVTATVECIPLIASSIMSKKLAEGIDGLVLDVKTGSGAFMARREDARALATTMVAIGRTAGRDVVARITDMSQPIGRWVGNALEVIESVEVLQGRGPADLRALTIELTAEMLVLAGSDATHDAGRARAARILDSGAALERFERVVEAQGGDPRALTDRSRLPGYRSRLDVAAASDGFVSAMDCAEIGRASLMIGAGRARKEDAIDPGVGIQVHARLGDRVEAGAPLFTLCYNDDREVVAAARRLRAAVAIVDEPGPVPALLGERIG